MRAQPQIQTPQHWRPPMSQQWRQAAAAAEALLKAPPAQQLLPNRGGSMRARARLLRVQPPACCAILNPAPATIPRHRINQSEWQRSAQRTCPYKAAPQPLVVMLYIDAQVTRLHAPGRLGAPAKTSPASRPCPRSSPSPRRGAHAARPRWARPAHAGRLPAAELKLRRQMS